MTQDQVGKPTIRPALASDIPAMCDLFSLDVDSSTDRTKCEQDLKLLLDQSPGSSALFVAAREGQVLGLCSVRAVTSSGEGGSAGIVENLAVHRDYPGQGIGGSLLGSAMAWCTGQGITRMHLSADGNDASGLQFYFSRGWTGAGSIRLKNGF